MKWNGIILCTVLQICLLVQESCGEKVATDQVKTKGREEKNKLINHSEPKWPKKGHLQDDNEKKREFGDWLVPGAEPIESCGNRIGHMNYATPTTSSPIDDRNQTRARRDRVQASATTTTYAGEFPSYVLIKVGGDISGLQRTCAGALVGPSLVITAAHCLNQLSETRQVFVLLGINSPGKEHQRTVHVSDFCFPENACGRSSEFLDFAFLKLKYPVNYTTYIQPACLLPALNPGKEILLGDFQFASIGYNESGSPSTALRKSYFKRGCGHLWQDRYRWMRRSVQCYLSMKGSQPCALDFGGPMYAMGRIGQMLGRHIVVGISSFNANQMCEVKPRKPSYFMEMTRLKGDLALSARNCRSRMEIDLNHAGKRCFEPRQMEDRLDPRINFDEYVNIPDKVTEDKKHKPDRIENIYKPIPGGEPLQTCGLKTHWFEHSEDQNETDLSDGEFPSYVLFGHDGIEKEPELRCGGALIGPNLIVTSASCVTEKQNLVAYVGVTDKSRKDHPLGIEVPVKEICLYSKWCSRWPHYANLAFVKLMKRVDYTDKVFPACFLPDYNRPNNIWDTDTVESVTLTYQQDGERMIKSRLPKHFSFPRNVANISECHPMVPSHPWLKNMTSCYKGPYNATIDTGSPLYLSDPGLDDRAIVVGVNLRSEILPKDVHKKSSRGKFKIRVDKPTKKPTFESFNDIYKSRHMIEPILANCKPANQMDTDDYEQYCYLIENEVKKSDQG